MLNLMFGKVARNKTNRQFRKQNTTIIIPNIEINDFGRIKELIEKYRDLPMDFADSCLVYLVEKLNLKIIATIDRDFAVYCIQGRKKFKIILS